MSITDYSADVSQETQLYTYTINQSINQSQIHNPTNMPLMMQHLLVLIRIFFVHLQLLSLPTYCYK